MLSMYNSACNCRKFVEKLPEEQLVSRIHIIKNNKSQIVYNPRFVIKSIVRNFFICLKLYKAARAWLDG